MVKSGIGIDRGRSDVLHFLHGNGQAPPSRAAAVDVGVQFGPAAQRGPSFYERLNRVLDAAGLRRLRRGAVRQVLCRRGRSAEPGAGPLLPDAAARLLRGAGLGTGDCVAGRRFAEPAAVPRRVARRGAAGPLDGVAHAASDRRRDAPGGLHLGCCSGWPTRPGPGARRSGIDATTLEANAALLQHRTPGYGRGLRDVSAPTGGGFGHRHADARRVGPPDRKRPKKGSNDDWTHPKDPDAKITKMKDGRTRLAHKAEHAVDLETGAVVGVSVQDADAATPRRCSRRWLPPPSRSTRCCRRGPASRNWSATRLPQQPDTGHVAEVEIRSYVSEPDRGPAQLAREARRP